MLRRVLASVLRHLPAEEASAHCDIPCGIYDPHMAQIAALTIIRMNQLASGLTPPGNNASKEELDNYHSLLARYTVVKEQHAELCKHELRILWGDYFKPNHLEQFPELHNLFWDAMRLASTARQGLNMEASQQLLANVQQIAEIFWKSKGATVRRQPSMQTAGGELVYPVAS